MLFKRNTQPKWSQALTSDQFDVFKKMLLERSNGLFDADKADKEGSITTDQIVGSLHNIIGLCANLPEEDWPAEIDNYVNAFSVVQEGPKYPRDKDSLVLQLYPNGYFDQADGSQPSLTRDDIPGIHTALVLDTPLALVTVSDKPDGAWHKHEKELFKVAFQRLLKQPPYAANFLDKTAASRNVAIIESPDVTTATHVLALDELYPELVGKEGALVALPIRNLFAVIRLDKRFTPEDIGTLKGLAKFFIERNPYFLSDKVYHYKAGKFKVVDYEDTV